MSFPVSRKESVYDFHSSATGSMDDASDWSESHCIKVVIVTCIDEQLGCTSIGASGSKRHSPTLIGLTSRSSCMGLLLQLWLTRGALWIPNCAINPRMTRKKGIFGKKPFLGECVETIGSQGCPRTMDFDKKVSLSIRHVQCSALER